ncbi:unnamed protein product [Rhizoctonia solani]|uniref:HPt domain-containing protein n=3 Tax=Rhizoctonia solani TaxID=456999 RepID=A0A8H3DQK9_9AGAM|nr:histidine containing phosphotransfer, Hpt protein [Rhizoctonia solani AG-3 Rhs1AP]KEP54022.1 multistep phosphorelay regulator 1 [Rhizoctonia solani 123E]CAE6522808.1 unnamed protein product [Rhizoctonia solani]CAE6539743.1 unnamed protein product [Rhizoctonia solani]
MSAPTSPSAARRYTSPPVTSPTSPTTVRAASVKPATPEKAKAATPAPASPPKPSPKKTDDDKDKGKKPVSPTKDKPVSTADEALPVVSGPDILEDVFGQITEMDEDDDAFSSEIVRDYFKQAATTFEEIRDALAAKDFKSLSSKGHFLKGSSAALGIKKVQDWCEHIQHYGNKRDEVKGVDLTETQALRRIELIMPRLEQDYESAKAWLHDYYTKQGVDLDEEPED